MHAWSVDYSPVSPNFISLGSNDRPVMIRSADQRNIDLTTDNETANVSVKLDPTSAETSFFGSVNYHVHYFDPRNTRDALRVFHGQRERKSAKTN